MASSTVDQTQDLEQRSVSARLREATQAEHSMTETQSFMQRLLGGELGLDAYRRYLGQYARVYEQLEQRQPQSGDLTVATDVRLHRFAAIESDLRALGAQDWRVEVDELPATRQYVARLKGIVQDADPVLYLAHHYTRYLGDLSGGQIIAKMLARHYGATDDQLSFYRFEQIENLVPFKREYRRAIDEAGFDEQQVERLIEETKAAYVFNGHIFEELCR